MSKTRPTFHNAWAAFRTVNVPVRAVGKIIGGVVQKNTELDEKLGGFANACPIRMSYVLNKTGFPIVKSPTYKTVSGADHHQYLFHVKEVLINLTFE